MTGGLIYTPSDTQAPADDLAPAEGPLGSQRPLIDTYDIQLSTKTLVDLYDILVGRTLTSPYDIWLSSKTLVNPYDIQLPTKTLVDLYDIYMVKTLVDIYDIQLPTKTLVDLFDIQLPAKTIQDYYDIWLSTKTLIDLYDIVEPTWSYYYVNGLDISDYILANPGVSWSGYTPKMNVIRHARTARDSEIRMDGWDPLVFRASLLLAGTNGETNDAAVRLVIADESGDYTAYLGRSDRFYNVTSTRLLPTWSPGWRGVAAKYDLELTFEEPYSWEDQTYDIWSPGSVILPQTSSDLSNVGGEIDTPVYSASVTGHYADSSHLTNVYLKLYDESSVLVASLELTDQLLSEEVVELDHRHRYLTFTYSDDYSSSTIWGQDATQSGCTCSGGEVSIPATKYYYYRFKGPHPQIASEGIKLTATITVGAGSPIIQYSTDGTNWNTSVSAADIAAGSGKSTVYYLNGTSLQSDIYIRFYSPSGASMTVQDVEFVAKRDIQGEDILEIPRDATYTVTVEGDGSSSATPVITFRPRYYPQ